MSEQTLTAFLRAFVAATPELAASTRLDMSQKTPPGHYVPMQDDLDAVEQLLERHTHLAAQIVEAVIRGLAESASTDTTKRPSDLVEASAHVSLRSIPTAEEGAEMRRELRAMYARLGH